MNYAMPGYYWDEYDVLEQKRSIKDFRYSMTVDVVKRNDGKYYCMIHYNNFERVVENEEHTFRTWFSTYRYLRVIGAHPLFTIWYKIIFKRPVHVYFEVIEASINDEYFRGDFNEADFNQSDENQG